MVLTEVYTANILGGFLSFNECLLGDYMGDLLGISDFY